MIIRRVIGWCFLLAGLVVLARDVRVWIDTKHWMPIDLGQLWYDLGRSSLHLVQAGIERYLHPFLWDPILTTVLSCWAAPVLVLLGLFMLAVSGRARSRRAGRAAPAGRHWS